jgi:hypothetical protein
VRAHFAKSGITVERFNLGKEPMAFVKNAQVKGLLDSDGPEVLPLVLRDGELKCQGHYPDDAERIAWVREALSPETSSASSCESAASAVWSLIPSSLASSCLPGIPADHRPRRI